MNMRSVNNFFKYHNAVPLLLAVVVLGAGAAFAASPDLRQSVFSPGISDVPKILPAKKTDVTKLSAINVGKYDFDLRIDALHEDTKQYFVAYSYRTLEVIENAWQETRKSEKLTISKELLGRRRLDEYLSDQIGQVIGRQVAYLSEVQTSVSGKTPTKVVAKEYESLIGEPIDIRNNDSSGSEGTPVREEVSMVASEERNAEATHTNSKQTDIPKDAYSKAEIEKMIVTAVADFLAVDMSMPENMTPLDVNE